jgi:hypothetical protein
VFISHALRPGIGDFRRGYLIVDRAGVRVLRDAAPERLRLKLEIDNG